MIPYAASPAVVLTIAAMMNDEDIARATERRRAHDLGLARRAESRRRAQAADRTPAPRRRWRRWTRVAGRPRMAH